MWTFMCCVQWRMVSSNQKVCSWLRVIPLILLGGIIMIARSPIYQPLIRGFTSIKACQFHQQPRQRNSWSTLQAACRRYPHVFTVILLDSSCASGFISIFLGSTLYFCLVPQLSWPFLAVLAVGFIPCPRLSQEHPDLLIVICMGNPVVSGRFSGFPLHPHEPLARFGLVRSRGNQHWINLVPLLW